MYNVFNRNYWAFLAPGVHVRGSAEDGGGERED
jgi:hypothetical protein